MSTPGSATPATAAGWQGRALVLLQFALLAAMGWRAAAAPASMAPVAANVLLLAAAALGLWALTANRPGNFNIRPEPRPDGVLVTGGPYRWVRHPMYTAVLLAAAAAALTTGGLQDALLGLALLVVLWAKAGIEERALVQRFAGYGDYQARTRRFLPGLL